MERKYAIITGSARRLGREIALNLAAKGFDLLLLYHHSKAEAEETCHQAEALGVCCTLHCVDLAHPENLPDFMETLYKNGSLRGQGVLINNASVFQRMSLTETTPELLDETFRVNFFSPYQLSRCFAKYAAPGSSIINITDSKATKNGTAYSAYILSKKALVDVTLQFAAALAPNIRINAVSPGSILPSGGEPEEEFWRRIEKAPMRNAGNMESVLAAITFLLENADITGQILYVDGGMHTITGEL